MFIFIRSNDLYVFHHDVVYDAVLFMCFSN